MDKKVYVTDYVGDEYLQWKDGDTVIISTPTGSGKTTFVISELLQYAVRQKKAYHLLLQPEGVTRAGHCSLKGGY